MNLPQDFKEFIELLNEKNVRYLLVGGYAVAFHSRPKVTEDIDFWIEPSLKNALKIVAVLREFGFAGLGLTTDDFMNADQVIQLGYPPLRIDLMMSVSGLDFETAFSRRVVDTIEGLTISFLAIEDLMINKKASGRKKDQFDMDWLKTYKKNKI